MMYASLDLPGMVQEATKDLPDHLVKDCFSNILVTGKKNQQFTHFLYTVDFNLLFNKVDIESATYYQRALWDLAQTPS